MIGYDEARAIAQRLLDTLDVDRPVKIVDSLTRQSGRRWAFVFQSSQYLESGDFLDALAGNAPILVEKADGSSSFGRTDKSVESQL